MMVDNWQTRRREPEEIPIEPRNVFECVDLLQSLVPAVDQIKRILEAKGLSVKFSHEEWEVPVTVDELQRVTHRLLVDFQNVRSILLANGLANEMEFIPLQPRWRVDGRKHHQRNSIQLEGVVRDIIKAVQDGKPFPQWAIDTYDITPEQIETWIGCFDTDWLNQSMRDYVDHCRNANFGFDSRTHKG